VEAMRKINPEAIAWFERIGFDKLTLLHSPVCRYGVVTSNNVESVNSRIRHARKLPILELLMALEQMVVVDRATRFAQAQHWPHSLTKHADKMLRKAIAEASEITLQQQQTSEMDIAVIKHTSQGEMRFHVTLAAGGVSCSCGHPKQFLFPCSHVMRVLQDRQLQVEDFCCPSWTKEVCLSGHAEPTTSRPLVAKEDLTPRDIKPPVLRRKRGRPKKSRIESQPATKQLDAPPRRQCRCSRCGELGHNKRNCRAPPNNQTSAGVVQPR
jgi:hypothetical protein